MTAAAMSEVERVAGVEAFDYRRSKEVEDGVPWVIEAAFGWCPEAPEKASVRSKTGSSLGSAMALPRVP